VIPRVDFWLVRPQFTTALSTIYLIVKACLFLFGTGTWLPELMIFGSFVVPWLEAFVWFVRNREILQESVNRKGMLPHTPYVFHSRSFGQQRLRSPSIPRFLPRQSLLSRNASTLSRYMSSHCLRRSRAPRAPARMGT
jgi:hypothetical protein